MKTAPLLVLVALIAVGVDMTCALRSPSKRLQKPGVCPPVPPGTVGTCAEYCSGDESCPNKTKCCSNGCGHVCKAPVFKKLPRPVKGGLDTQKSD